MYFLGDLMSKERDINTLLELTRKFGQTFGSEVSLPYTEFDFEYNIRIQFGLPYHSFNSFSLVFPKTPGKLSLKGLTHSLSFNQNVKAVYRIARCQFRELWSRSPEVFNTDGSVEQEELMKEMWDHIAPDEMFCQYCKKVWYECDKYPKCEYTIWGTLQKNY